MPLNEKYSYNNGSDENMVTATLECDLGTKNDENETLKCDFGTMDHNK